MNRILKWTLGTIAGLGMVGLLIFAFVEGREELAREREREQPIKVAPKISRTPEGDLIITVDMDTQKRIGLETAALEARTARPEVVAYGRLQEVRLRHLWRVRRLPGSFGQAQAATGPHWANSSPTAFPSDRSNRA